jgi:hypothetical protein
LGKWRRRRRKTNAETQRAQRKEEGKVGRIESVRALVERHPLGGLRAGHTPKPEIPGAKSIRN